MNSDPVTGAAGPKLSLLHSSPPATHGHDVDDVTNVVIVPPPNYFQDGPPKGAAPLAAAGTPGVGLTVADVAELLLGPPDSECDSGVWTPGLTTGAQEHRTFPITDGADVSSSEDGFWESLWVLANRQGSNEEAAGNALNGVIRVPAAAQEQGGWSQGAAQGRQGALQPAAAAEGYDTLIEILGKAPDSLGTAQRRQAAAGLDTLIAPPSNVHDSHVAHAVAERGSSPASQDTSPSSLPVAPASQHQTGDCVGMDFRARAATCSLTGVEGVEGKFPTALKGKVSKLPTLGEELWRNGITLGVERFLLPGGTTRASQGPRSNDTQRHAAVPGLTSGAAAVEGHEAAVGHFDWGGRSLPSTRDSLCANGVGGTPQGLTLLHESAGCPEGHAPGASNALGSFSCGADDMLSVQAHARGAGAAMRTALGKQPNRGAAAPGHASGIVPEPPATHSSALSFADRLASTIQDLRTKKIRVHSSPSMPSFYPAVCGVHIQHPHCGHRPSWQVPGSGVGGGPFAAPLQELGTSKMELGSTVLTPKSLKGVSARSVKRVSKPSWTSLAGRTVDRACVGTRNNVRAGGNTQVQAREESGGEGSVPRLPGGQKLLLLRMLFIEAAQTLERGDKEKFRNLAPLLKPYAKKTGDWCERVVYCVLRSLTLRAQGSAYASLKKQGRLTIQEMEEAIVWCYTASPGYPFVSFAMIGMVAPKLLGHSHVHLVTMGLIAPPMISAIMKLLATQNMEGRGTSGSEATDQKAILQSFRVTSLRGPSLARGLPRSEYETLQNHGQVARVLQSVATSLGIEFSFDGIFLKENCLRLFDEVVRKPGEVVAVCIPFDLKLYGEDLGPYGSPLEHLGRFLQRMKPEIVVVAEDNVAANGPNSVARMAHVLEFMWCYYHANDAIADFADLKHMYNFEQQYWNIVCCSVVGCEGEERRWRPTSMEQRADQFRSWGFVPLRVPEVLVESLTDLSMVPYPEGFGVSVGEFDLCGTWMGHSLLGIQSWTFKDVC